MKAPKKHPFFLLDLGTHKVTLSFRIPKWEAEAIEEHRKKIGFSKSRYIKRALRLMHSAVQHALEESF